MINRAFLSLSLAATISIAAVQTASAQFGDTAGFAELNQHDYLHRDLILFAQALEMDEGQRIIVESLYEDYRDEFDSGWNRTQQRFADMREELQAVDRDQVMALVLAPFENWQREKDDIKRRFEENVQVILNQHQLSRWPAFERQMLREKTLHRGRLSGESLNLFHVLRDLRLDDRTRMAVEPVMEQYDIALNEALKRRNDTLLEGQNDVLRTMRNPELGINLERISRQINARVAVRDINDQFIEIVAASLPESLGEEFRSSALERAYPRVFRTLPAQRVFTEAKRIDGLEPDILAAVEDLEAGMLAEVEAINLRLHQGVRQHEPRGMQNQAEIIASRQSGDDVARINDPNITDFRQRDERVGYYMTQLRQTIGQERFASLPGASRWAPEQRIDPSAPLTPADREQAIRQRIEQGETPESREQRAREQRSSERTDESPRP